MKLLNFLIRLFLQRNKGFSETDVQKQIEEDGDHFTSEEGELGNRFGAANEVINESGQWNTVEGEVQRNQWFDTFGCTVYNTENPIQILMKHKYNIFEEYSERYNGVLANIKIGFGGSPHTAAETYRKYGALLSKDLPFNDTIRNAYQFYQPKPMTQNYIDKGKKWLDNWEFGHEWFWDFSHDNIKEMLKYSPLGVGLHAWKKNSEGIYYKPKWATDNHWTTLIGYVENEYWIIFDSYKENGTFIKHLDWNYNFKFCKRYYLGQINPDDQELQKGKELYSNLKKKHIMVVDTGEIWSVKDGYELYYEFWGTNSDWLQDILDTGLRDEEQKKTFTGISREDFNILKRACLVSGGRISADSETVNRLTGLLKELTK